MYLSKACNFLKIYFIFNHMYVCGYMSVHTCSYTGAGGGQKRTWAPMDVESAVNLWMQVLELSPASQEDQCVLPTTELHLQTYLFRSFVFLFLPSLSPHPLSLFFLWRLSLMWCRSYVDLNAIKMTLNSWSFCPRFPSGEVTGVCHHTWSTASGLCKVLLE